MRRRLVATIGLALLGLAGTSARAWPADMRVADIHVTELVPAARAVPAERSIDFFVRFDRPVDHVYSFFAILRDGEVIELLRPRLEAAPNVLFARTSTPAPGHYILHWTVLSRTGGDAAQGEIAFTVVEMR